MDVWSLGCIMGELFFRKVMFETETTGDLAMVRFKAGWPPELPPQVIKHPRLSSSQTSLSASRAATAQGPPELQLLSSLSGQARLRERGRRALSRMPCESSKPRCLKRCYPGCRMQGQPGAASSPPRCCLKMGHGLDNTSRRGPRMPCCHCKVCFEEDWTSNPPDLLREAR